MYHIESDNEFKLEWLSLTFGIKEKWGWPYVRSTWGAGMSSTQLSESFNIFLKGILALIII